MHILNLQVAVALLFCIEVYLIAPHVKKARGSVISDFHFEDLVYYILFTSKKYGKYKVQDITCFSKMLLSSEATACIDKGGSALN